MNHPISLIFTIITLLVTSSLGLQAATWESDFETVANTAKEERKHILLYFTGSGWCPPCIQMEKDVFSKEPFKDFAKEKLVLMKLDFDERGNPRSKDYGEQHAALKQWLRAQGYPTLVLLTPDSEYIDATGYRKGDDSEKYVAHLKEIYGIDS